MEQGAKARLIIICGLPGSGKTTVARELETRLGAVRFSAAEWMTALNMSLYDQDGRARIEALQWGQAQRLLRLGLTVIVEWGTWSRSERDVLRKAARDAGAAVELRYLHAPAEILFERIRRRGREVPPIAAADIVRWSEMFEAPTAEEMALFDPPLPEV